LEIQKIARANCRDCRSGHGLDNLSFIAFSFLKNLKKRIVTISLPFLACGLAGITLVPTRGSYVMAVALPEERPAAASMTSVSS
jgi:hypothetical protein